MKHSLLIFSLAFIALSANAQTKAIDFYSLLQSLIPNETSSLVANWNTNNSTSIKWQSPTPQKMGLSFAKNGKAAISFNGATYKCGDANKPCNWEISLSGKTMSGYSEFEINGYPTSEVDVSLDKLFGKKQYELKLLKTDNEGALTRFSFYEIKLPGKNTVWIMTGISSDDNALLMNISCFFNKKEMEERMSD